MNKKTKVLMAIGGTGGHVFPGCHLAQHLNDQNYQVQLTLLTLLKRKEIILLLQFYLKVKTCNSILKEEFHYQTNY